MAHYTDPEKQKRVVSKPFKGGMPKPTKWLVLGLVGVLVVGGLVWLGYHQVQVQNSKYSTACTDKNANGVLTDAAKFTAADQYANLQKDVNKITALPEYQKDPNCLAIVLTYYINLSDNVKARQYYDQLKVVYQPKKGYDKSIKAVVKTPEQFLVLVQFLDKQAEQAKKNSYYGPVVQ